MVPFRSVMIWANAFIPRDVPGYTRKIDAGDDAGSTVIPDPGSNLIFWNTCQRSFSTNVNAESKMQLRFRLDFPHDAWEHKLDAPSAWQRCVPKLSTKKYQIADSIITEEELKQFGDSRGFAHYNSHQSDKAVQASKQMLKLKRIEDGKGEVSGQPKVLNVRLKSEFPPTLMPFFTAFHGTRFARPNLGIAQEIESVEIEMQGKCGNILFPLSPAIDFSSVITIYPVQRYIEFEGWHDDFPAFEINAQIDGNPPQWLYQRLPEGGKTVMNLFTQPGLGSARSRMGEINFKFARNL
ncbi:MAG: DUF3238 domain-containing protein [Gemmataceae bacterium]